MKSQQKREYTKETYLANGFKSQNQHAKNSFNTTIEQPGTNESGLDAKKKGF